MTPESSANLPLQGYRRVARQPTGSLTWRTDSCHCPKCRLLGHLRRFSLAAGM